MDAQGAARLRDIIQRDIEAAVLRPPQGGESEKKYVASVLRPVVQKQVTRLRELTLLGEGSRSAPPVHFLGLYFYPDLAVMLYQTRLIAVEVKYVDFSSSLGALATAVGQGVVYTIDGYMASLIVAVGNHARSTDTAIEYENTRLADVGAPWRICSPKLAP